MENQRKSSKRLNKLLEKKIEISEMRAAERQLELKPRQKGRASPLWKV